MTKHEEVVPVDKLKKRLKKMKKEGHKKLSVEMSTECMKSCLQEIAPLLQFVLFNTPKAENYLSMSFVNDKDETHNFEVCLHKHGKKWPIEVLDLIELHNKEDLLKLRVKALEGAARELRAAQKAYMAHRGDEMYGKAVANAAEKLDRVLESEP